MCDCGREQSPLFTADYGEYDGESWCPLEEAGNARMDSNPVGVTIGRGYTLQLYYCPESELHANRVVMF
ncbi:hypothetical protein [Stackebrandtia albiflava]|uniref:hypothetical protein n=1 Tax=Stackebrandtia albiflava TaxID=406432 RepID=UPI0011BF57E7|nr:hypothetical protein [Stackebrandtia albiflava]